MRRREVDAFFWLVGGELQRMTEDLMRLRPQFAHRRGWEPRVDLLEEPERLVIRSEIAGVRGEDIHLLYIPDRHVVILRGRRNEEDFGHDRTGAFQLEIYYGDFEREVKLPDVEIVPQGMRATYRNGMLTVVLPKRSRSRAEIESY
jgi:HSP20 family protein